MTEITVGPDTFVTLSYVLFDEQGETVDQATVNEPLTYVHGYAQIVPGLERGLTGLKAGEKREILVEPEEGFGDRDDEGVFEVDKSDFPDSAVVAPGDEFVAQGPDGEPIEMRIVEILPEAFVVDTNHPLAGQRLRFEVEVSDVRQASEEEIATAQADLEHHIGGDHACCDHDHGKGGGHTNDHGHNSSEQLVRLGKKA
jgi:FKBP-type peptidyl-prolyl cis-trans isomerase SlyD